jgi:hypothetical protein
MVSYLACQMSDTLGYSVVKPLKPMAFDDLRALLPVSARGKFPDDPLLLIEMVDSSIGNDTLTADLPTPDRRPAPPANIEAPPPPPADSKATDAGAEPSLFTSMQSSSMAWDFTVVVITVLVFVMVLAGSYWLWTM